MMKDASPETALLLAQAEAIAKGIDPTSVTLEDLDPSKGSSAMPSLTDEVRAALPPEVQEHIKSLETAASAAVTKAVESADDLDAAEFEKALAGLPEPVRKAMQENQARTVRAEAMAKALHDKDQNAEFGAFAKSLDFLPGVNAESASTFRKAAESNPTAWVEIAKTLTGANEAMKVSGLFKEIGTSAPGSATGEQGIEAIAKALVGTNPALSYAEAVAQAAQDNPELYAAHRKEA